MGAGRGVATSGRGDGAARRRRRLAATVATGVVGSAGLLALAPAASADQTQQYQVNCSTTVRSASTGVVSRPNAPASRRASAVVPASVVSGTRYDITQIESTTTWSPDAAQTLRLRGRTATASGERLALPGGETKLTNQFAPTLTTDASGGVVLRTPKHTYTATAPTHLTCRSEDV